MATDHELAKRIIDACNRGHGASIARALMGGNPGTLADYGSEIKNKPFRPGDAMNLWTTEEPTEPGWYWVQHGCWEPEALWRGSDGEWMLGGAVVEISPHHKFHPTPLTPPEGWE